MAEWWEAAPLVEQPAQNAPAPGNWWEDAPLVEQGATAAPPAPDPYQQAAVAARDKERAQGFDTDAGYGRQAIQGLTLGLGDEVLAGLRTPIEMAKHGTLNPVEGFNYAKARENLALADARKNNGLLGTGAELAGGLVTGGALAPLTASARFAKSAFLPRVGAGMFDGGVLGGIYGAGSGEGTEDRAEQGVVGAGKGIIAGGAFPFVASGVGRSYEVVRNLILGNRIAKQAGANPETLRMLGNVMDADGSLGAAGQANIARAGSEGMLADAGPNAKAVLDTAIQRGGPGAVEAQRAIADRTAKASNSLTGALDDTMGRPGESMSREMVVYGDKTNPMSLLYKKAYETPIDYAHPAAMRIESAVKTRVPSNAIAAANNLMRVEGNSSKQIMAHLADDGSVVFERMPDVRQLDYITRGLNEVADQANGMGKLGGTTATGRAYSNLSREIRNDLKEVVPEYKSALDRASSEIGKRNAEDFGTKMLSPSVTRDEVRDFVVDMPLAEKTKLAQGIRSQIDDAMARVTRTVQDGDTGAREAIKAIKDLSSRANREKLELAIGKEKAGPLFDEIDRAAMSFDLRAAVAENSKTFARQATAQRVGDLTKPGITGTALQGEPINATKRMVQALTGRTPEAIRGQQDEIYSELSRLLTRRGGAGQGVYDATRKLGQTDQATKVTKDQILRLLTGTHLSYPAAMLGPTYTRR